MEIEQSSATVSLPLSGTIPRSTSEKAASSRRRFPWAVFSATVFGLLAVSGIGYVCWRYRVQPFPYAPLECLPRPAFEDGELVLRTPNGNLAGRLGLYSDELTSYLQYEYLKGLTSLAGSTILITTSETDQGPRYALYVVLQNDMLAASRRLAELQIAGYIHGFELDSPSTFELREWTKQTGLFEAAYHRPVRQRLLQLPRSQLTSAVATFILFRTRTDRRVRERIVPAGMTFTAEDAREFAADMIDVANFYSIPLDMLLGIGAMENNYLDIRGDLKHAIWKKHAQKGDVVLRRKGARVLVSNYSVGPWQITQETLRYVHLLYRQDKRDYSKLPARLRPPKELDLAQVDTHVLTTYAGLLLRKLLDSFDGDVTKAQGAYNGGWGRPNLTYSEGVTMVANYAHRVLSMAAGRKGNSVGETALTVAKE